MSSPFDVLEHGGISLDPFEKPRYYLSNCIRKTKIFFAVMGGLFGLAGCIYGGIETKDGFLIGLGAFDMLLSIFALWDATKRELDLRTHVNMLDSGLRQFKNLANKYREERDKFAKENVKFAEENDRLIAIEDEFESLEDKLREDLEEERRISANLDKIAKEYKRQSELYGAENERLTTTSVEFRIELNNLRQIHESNQKTIDELTRIKDDYSMQLQRYAEALEQEKELINIQIKENEKLGIENAALEQKLEELTSQITRLEQQLMKVAELYKNSKALLAQTMQLESELAGLGTNLHTDVALLDDISEEYQDGLVKLNELIVHQTDRLELLTKEQFNKLDANQDGSLTFQELQAGRLIGE